MKENCNTCKHLQNPQNEHPCRNCITYGGSFNNWEAKEMTRETERQIERMLEESRKEQEIACPYCGITHPNDDMQYPVTYWGNDGCTEMTCEACNGKFWVKEDVRRTYRVAKTYEELGL